MTTVVYAYQIPDPRKPTPLNKRGLGPSGRLTPFAPPPISAEQVVGRTVDEISCSVGTYGMGGPGFFGLRMGSEWLVVAVWGAGEWMTAQGRCVEDMRHHKYGRPRPWLAAEGDELSPQVIGQKVRSIDVQHHSLRIVLENEVDLAIEEASDRRPIFEGTREPRRFADDDDLRRAVFLSPTSEIWV